MKKFFVTMLIGATLSISSTSWASTCCGADEADADGAAASSKTCAPTDSAGMVKGGGTEANEKTGYELGDKVPTFSLADSAGNTHTLSDYPGKVVMLVFYNQQCPYVQDATPRIASFAKEYKDKGVEVLAIDAGTNNGKADIAANAKDKPYTILLNPDSSLARNFGATYTPEVYLLDKNGVLVYEGMFDSGRNVNEKGEHESPAKNAVDDVLAGKEVTVKTKKGVGCSIKYAKIEAPAPQKAAP